MRKPLAEGSPIDTKRYRRWINRFGSYRDPVTRPMIEDWLSQFKKTDTDLAARILDSVEYFGNSQIWAAYREALDSLQGWSRRSAERKSRCGF